MYVYVNTTEAALQENFTKLFELQERIRNGTGESVVPEDIKSGATRVNGVFNAVPQKRSLFLQSCSLSRPQTTKRSTPPTPSSSCS